MTVTQAPSSVSHTTSSSDRVTHRKNIYVIFIEFNDSDTSDIISLLRSHNFAPRGRNVEDWEQITQALSERVWDIIICKEQLNSFDPLSMIKKLHALEKDIPVIMLSETFVPERINVALQNDVQAFLPLNQPKLLLIHLEREYSHLETRRQARLTQLQLSECQKRNKLLMDCSSMPICFVSNQKVIYLNEAFCRLFGYQVTDQLLHKPLAALVASQERKGLTKLISEFLDTRQSKQTYQLLGRRADDSNFTLHLALQQAHYQDMSCIEITIENDISNAQQTKFDDLDPITGLYNGNYFSSTLEGNVRQAQRGSNDCHLLYIDILNLAQTKQQLGTEASKMLARDITDILNETFNKSHLKSRIKDNIFTVIYSDPDVDKAINITNTLYHRFKNHLSKLDNQTIEVSSAIAIVPISETTASVAQILKRGEEVIQQCLESEDDRVSVFNIELSSAQQEQIQSIEQATYAIENNRLRLLFQPIVPLVFSSDQHYYEVLLRMVGDEDEDIPPAHFFDSMAYANLNERMDRWVINDSTQQLRQQLDSHQQLKLFISITDTVWEQQDFLVWIVEILRSTRIPADHLVIQISETEAASSLSRAKYFVEGLRKLNCLICLKHYGSTNNSHNVLKTLDPHYIKFDASYIQDISEGTNYDANFETLLSDLNSLGKITIAPQVETPKVISTLWKFGIGMVQGYYFQAPDKKLCYDFTSN